MSPCPNEAADAKNCSCTYPCERRGRCCECVAYHRAAGEVPGCFFTAKGETTWDRSVSAFVRDRGTES